MCQSSGLHEHRKATVTRMSLKRKTCAALLTESRSVSQICGQTVGSLVLTDSMYMKMLRELKWIEAASRPRRSIFSLPAMAWHSSMLTTCFPFSYPYLIRSFWNMIQDKGVFCSRAKLTSAILCQMRSKTSLSFSPGFRALQLRYMSVQV